jgi:IclR family mhp operon transcriptional activator
LAYLAYCPDEQRETLLDVLSRSDAHPSDVMARNPRLIHKILGEVRERGYATTTRLHMNDSAIAVPVLPHGRIVAAISLRYIDSALPVSAVVDKYFGELINTAQDIATAFEEKS